MMVILPALEFTAQELLAFHKGILAADESNPTLEKRFLEFHIPATEESRYAYREMLLTTPLLNEYIGGVILFDETIRQKSTDGTPIAEALSNQGIIPGIKVDQGTKFLDGYPGEKVTQGLEGLYDRLVEYRELGARFTKWRAIITIGDQIPSYTCINANAMALAHFARISQEAGLLPIVEAETLMNGNHSLVRCGEVTTEMLECVFGALSNQSVVLEQMLLKTNMVTPGDKSFEEVSPNEIALATLDCLRRTVPKSVPGVVFLSGGQSEYLATQRLNAICKLPHSPWKLSFSFGRALQHSSLKAWNGSNQNTREAQTALHLRAQYNSLALEGKYTT